ARAYLRALALGADRRRWAGVGRWRLGGTGRLAGGRRLLGAPAIAAGLGAGRLLGAFGAGRGVGALAASHRRRALLVLAVAVAVQLKPLAGLAVAAFDPLVDGLHRAQVLLGDPVRFERAHRRDLA